jgi:hypothetical protein
MHEEQELPQLPEKGYLGDDASYGYDEHDMRDYGRQCASLAKPQPVGVTAFDEAVAAELPLVSSAPYNSREICQWFSERVRARLATLSAPVAQPGEAEPMPPADSAYWVNHDVTSPRAPAAAGPVDEYWLDGPYNGIDATPIAAEPVPSSCDGKEQDAFEEWALGQRYKMDLHPMFYLFLETKTAAARDGWKAGLEYAVKRMLAAPSQAAAVPEVVEREARRVVTFYTNYGTCKQTTNAIERLASALDRLAAPAPKETK